MARTALATQTADQNGTVVTPTAANADGHWIDPDDILLVVNGAGAPITVTLVTPETRAGLAVTDQTITVTNGTSKYIHVPKADQAPFVQPVGGSNPGMIYVDFSSVTTITCAAIGV